MDPKTSAKIHYYSLEEFESLINYTIDVKTRTFMCSFAQYLKAGKISEISFTKFSIFDTITPLSTIKNDQNTILTILNNLPNLRVSLTHQERGGIGCMLGMAIGDAMGQRLEFQPVSYNKIVLKDMGEGEGSGGPFKLLPGQWTDDTSMGLCLADSLLMKNGLFNPHDLMLRLLSWWYGGYNNAFRKNPRGSCGLGENTSASFKRYLKEFEPYTKVGDNNSSGNGTLVRNAAVPICFWRDINLACEIARNQSHVTHQGTEAAECCALLTYIVVNILNYKELNLKKFLEKLVEGYCEKGITIKGFETGEKSVKYLAESKQEGDNIDRDWNWRDKNFKYSPSRVKANPETIVLIQWMLYL